MEENVMNEKDKGRGGLRSSIYLLIVHRHKRKRIYLEKNKDLQLVQLINGLHH